MRMKTVGAKKQSGFTLIEVIVVTAIFAVLAAIAIPAFSTWGPKYRLKGSARDIYMVLSNLRSRAVRENAHAVIRFDRPTDSYTAFFDTGPPYSWSIDFFETVISSGTVEDGIDIYGSTLPGDTFGYDGRGTPPAPLAGPYEIYLKNQNGQYMGVRINVAGSLSIITSTDGGVTWN